MRRVLGIMQELREETDARPWIRRQRITFTHFLLYFSSANAAKVFAALDRWGGWILVEVPGAIPGVSVRGKARGVRGKMLQFVESYRRQAAIPWEEEAGRRRALAPNNLGIGPPIPRHQQQGQCRHCGWMPSVEQAEQSAGTTLATTSAGFSSSSSSSSTSSATGMSTDTPASTATPPTASVATATDNDQTNGQRQSGEEENSETETFTHSRSYDQDSITESLNNSDSVRTSGQEQQVRKKEVATQKNEEDWIHDIRVIRSIRKASQQQLQDREQATRKEEETEWEGSMTQFFAETRKRMQEEGQALADELQVRDFQKREVLENPTMVGRLLEIEREVLDNPKAEKRNEEGWTRAVVQNYHKWIDPDLFMVLIKASERIESITRNGLWLKPKEGYGPRSPEQRGAGIPDVAEMFSVFRGNQMRQLKPFEDDIYTHWWKTPKEATRYAAGRGMSGELSLVKIEQGLFHHFRWLKGGGQTKDALLTSVAVGQLHGASWVARAFIWDDFNMANQQIQEFQGEPLRSDFEPLVLNIVVPHPAACGCLDDEAAMVVSLAAVCNNCGTVHRCTCGAVLFITDLACRVCLRRRTVCQCLLLGGLERWLGWCLFCRRRKDCAVVAGFCG